MTEHAPAKLRIQTSSFNSERVRRLANRLHPTFVRQCRGLLLCTSSQSLVIQPSQGDLRMRVAGHPATTASASVRLTSKHPPALHSHEHRVSCDCGTQSLVWDPTSSPHVQQIMCSGGPGLLPKQKYCCLITKAISSRTGLYLRLQSPI